MSDTQQATLPPLAGTWGEDATREADAIWRERLPDLNAGFDALDAKGAAVYRRASGLADVSPGWCDMLARATLLAMCRGKLEVDAEDVEDAARILMRAGWERGR